MVKKNNKLLSVAEMHIYVFYYGWKPFKYKNAGYLMTIDAQICTWAGQKVPQVV